MPDSVKCIIQDRQESEKISAGIFNDLLNEREEIVRRIDPKFFVPGGINGLEKMSIYSLAASGPFGGGFGVRENN